MRKILFAMLVVALLSTPLMLRAQTLIDYTHYPLTAAREIPPAILIVMDNSVSMYRAAHEGNFNPERIYDGYFEPSASYAYSGGGYFYINDTGRWNGNFLNWLTMRRIDMVRKALIGGKTVAGTRNSSGVSHLIGEAAGDNGYTIVKLYPDGAGLLYPLPEELGMGPSSPVYFGLAEGLIFVGSTPDPITENVLQLAIRVVKEKLHEPEDFRNGEISGLLHSLAGRASLGLMLFNADGEGGRVVNPVGDELQNLVSTIETTPLVSWSPLAESLFEAVSYFMQIPPAYLHTPSDYLVGSHHDPFFCETFAETIPCARSFIILISDGESTHDQGIPQSPPNGETAHLRDYDADGHDIPLAAEEGSDFLDDVALWAHTSDLRTDAESDGEQTITLFTVSAFGSGTSLLRDAARNGGFVDANGNRRPDGSDEWDRNQDGLPDTAYEAGDASLLGEKLMQAAVSILSGNASPSNIAISSQSFQDEATVFQAFYQPSPAPEGLSIDWRGFLHALWIDAFGNIREDTDADQALVYDRDRIIRFSAEEESADGCAYLFGDDDGDGTADREVPDAVVPLTAIHPLWEAGENLALRNASERTIMTFVDGNGNGAVDDGEYLQFIPENAALLRPFLRAQDETEADAIIRYIRGEAVAGCRSRAAESGPPETVWKLGDVVRSTPAIAKEPLENYHIIYGDEGYETYVRRWKERPLTVFAGANDGMLHAFNAGIYHPGDNPATADQEEQGWYDRGPAGPLERGDERWAYIPYNLLPHLKWLTQNNYTHVDYVDLKPKITDARIFADASGNPLDADHPQGWGTVLIGGMGMGGGTIEVADDFGSGGESRVFRSAYFALDVTVPDHPRLLWEFTHPALGFTTVYPCVVRVETLGGYSQPEDDRWFVILGSGPTDYHGNSTQPARLFVVNLRTGALVRIMGGDGPPGFMASPVSVDANLDFNTDAVYAGESFMTGDQWQGGIRRISLKACTGAACNGTDPWPYSANPAAWNISTLCSTPQPVTAAPAVSLDEEEHLWVFFGTGRYFGFYDRADNGAENIFLGIKDPCYRGDCSSEVPFSRLYDSSPVIVYRDGTLSGTAISTFNDLEHEIEGRAGWYLGLAPGGERVLSKPGILGGALSFIGYTPDPDPCGIQDMSTLYTLYYRTGTAWIKPLFLPSRDDPVHSGGGQRDPKEEMKKKMTVRTSPFESPALRLGKTGTLVLPSSGTALEILPLAPPLKVKSGMESWREE
jgi:type IV pilus assembly protein PilY1